MVRHNELVPWCEPLQTETQVKKYVLAKVFFDTAENELSTLMYLIFFYTYTDLYFQMSEYKYHMSGPLFAGQLSGREGGCCRGA